MPVRPNALARKPLLSVAGASALPLRTLTLPPLQLLDVDTGLGRGLVSTVRLGAFSATMPLPPPGALSEWLRQTLDGTAVEQSGTAWLLDDRNTVRRGIDWAGGRLSCVRLPVLDAAASHQAVELGLEWLPQLVKEAATGERIVPGGSRRKPPLCANFRCRGLPAGGEAVQRVVLPEVRIRHEQAHDTRHPARPQLTFSDLQIDIAERGRAATAAWVQQVVADQQVTMPEWLDLEIDLLDSTLKNALATITVQGCRLRSLHESSFEAGAETAGCLSLVFSVTGLALTPVA